MYRRHEIVVTDAPKDTSIPTNPTVPSGTDDKDKTPATDVIPPSKPKKATKKTTISSAPDDTQGDTEPAE